ncbi:hypothetical protein BD626DRAFT_520451 [Schizophyllum amplum]|uniref:DUF6818 domain-containing protein n=1 Tax=Schizophyllum amplum TaxID=97359 RepID=A0A550BUP6_9AGAR|nr:hypothetical protein BD626DRAFT_520451 [Auriculariopsis ampla]
MHHQRLPFPPPTLPVYHTPKAIHAFTQPRPLWLPNAITLPRPSQTRLLPLSRTATNDENTAPTKTKRGGQTTAKASQQGAKVKADISRRGGRAPGQRNFTQTETELVLEVVAERLPLGSEAWGKTTDLYNERAAEAGLPSRDVAQIKRRFKKLVSEAEAKKPTGESKKAKNLRRALEIDYDIRAKFGAGVLDDGNRGEAGDLLSDDEGDNSDDIRSLYTDNDDDIEVVKTPASKKTTSTFTVEKRHRVENSLDVKPRARSSAAMNAITNLSAAFNPERLQQRDAAKAEQNALLIQLASEQAEIRRLHGEMDRLRDELAKERAARADDRLKWEQEKFDLKLQAIMQTRHDSRGRSHRRHHHRPRSPSTESRSRTHSSSASPPRKKPRVTQEVTMEAPGNAI